MFHTKKRALSESPEPIRAFIELLDRKGLTLGSAQKFFDFSIRTLYRLCDGEVKSANLSTFILFKKGIAKIKRLPDREPSARRILPLKYPSPARAKKEESISEQERSE
jgi:hypothetical protein